MGRATDATSIEEMDTIRALNLLAMLSVRFWKGCVLVLTDQVSLATLALHRHDVEDLEETIERGDDEFTIVSKEINYVVGRLIRS